MASTPFTDTSMRIVLLGKTGAGKSTSGNRILGKEAFKSDLSPESVTKECHKSTAKVSGLSVEVIDTPGTYDTELDEASLQKAVGRCIELSVPGPHAFLLVIRLDTRFTEEEMKAIEWIEKNFGEEALLYTIILFTHADCLGQKTVDQYIVGCQEIISVINSCGGRYHTFDNENNNRAEISELLRKVKEMVDQNGGKCYTNKDYEMAQQRLRKNRRKEKVIEGVLGAMTAVGAGAAVVGGVALVAASAVVVPVIAVGAGAAVGIGAGAGIIAHKVKTKEQNRDRQEEVVDSGSRFRARWRELKDKIKR